MSTTIPQGHQVKVTYEMYNNNPYKSENLDDCGDNEYDGSLTMSYESAIKILSSPAYAFTQNEEFLALVDVKKIVIDNQSYPLTYGRCSGACAVEKINLFIKHHFKL